MKFIPSDYFMKLVERMPRVCKLSSRLRVATLKNLKSKIDVDLFNTFFGYYMLPYYFIVLMSSLLFYNVENSKNN